MDGFNSEVIWTAKRIGMNPTEIVKLSCGEYYEFFKYEKRIYNAEIEAYEKANNKVSNNNFEE